MKEITISLYKVIAVIIFNLITLIGNVIYISRRRRRRKHK